MKPGSKRLLAASIAAAALAGCYYPKEPTYVRWTKSRETRLLAFKNIEILGVAPVIDATGKKELDGPALARAFASELVSYRRFRVVYPKKVGELFAQNGLADPAAASGLELLEAARAAKMDGLLVVRVEDFKPYFPPRIGVKIRLYATEVHGGLAASEILEWSDDGVPRDVSPALTDRFIWALDEVLDAHDRVTTDRVRAHAMDCDPRKHPMGPDIFLRSMDRFFEFLAHVSVERLYDDSLAYRSIRRRAERSRRRAASKGSADGYPIIMP